MIERYSSPLISDIFSLENKYRTFLQVEKEVAYANMKIGLISKSAYEDIRKNSDVDIYQINLLELTTRHDVLAFINYVTSKLTVGSKFFHYGITSTDIVDTSNSLMFQKANEYITNSLVTLINSLKEKAILYKDLPCIGRTHGQMGEETIFGLKFLRYYQSLTEILERFSSMRKYIEVCMVSGAMGNYSNTDNVVEEIVSKRLNLNLANITTQVVSRDRYSLYAFNLVQIVNQIDSLALEIRLLSRSEVSEVREGFGKGQQGSSAMPHKRNPILCENINGLARLSRGYLTSIMEDELLWHERDISHSSVERVALVDLIEITYFVINRMTNVINNLVVNQDNIKNNIKSALNVNYSENVLLYLVNKGQERDTSYKLIQQVAFEVNETKRDFFELLVEKGVILESDITFIKNNEEKKQKTTIIYKRCGIMI